MKTVQSDLVIIGAGLTGLALAYYLREQPLTVTLIEARDRIGGRMYTRYQEDQPPIELGATWLGNSHERLRELLQELNLDVFEQIMGPTAIYEPISTSPPQLVQLPPNDQPSFRIQGGSSVLIDKLASYLAPEHLYLGQAVQHIQEDGEYLIVETEAYQFKSKVVISTLPPFLFHSNIKVTPNLPSSLTQVAAQTHTWMGESIKVGLVYAEPFWRAENSSGTIFSNVGPIPEMYDHSDVDNQFFALKGFLNGAYYSVTKAQRLEMVLAQLEKYYGPQVREYVSYAELVWRAEPFTFTEYPSHILPHAQNGNPIYQRSWLNNRLYLAGSETATGYPGYMEGAVRSAQFVADQLISA